MGGTAPYNEHLGVQATSSQGHPSGLPCHSSSQRQEPTRSALLKGNGRASPPYGNLCSLLHLGRPQLKQVALPIFLARLFFRLSTFLHLHNSCRKDSGQSGW